MTKNDKMSGKIKKKKRKDHFKPFRVLTIAIDSKLTLGVIVVFFLILFSFGPKEGEVLLY